MGNKFNKSFIPKITERQESYYDDKIKALMEEANSEKEVDELIEEVLTEKESSLGKPLLKVKEAESGHMPYIEEYVEMNGEVVMDLDILNGEVVNIGSYLSDYFNYAQTEKMRLNYRMKSISGLVTDLNLLSNDTDENSIYFKDSFDDNSKIDLNFSIGTPAQISTIEGIATLRRIETNNRSLSSKVSIARGNGLFGTYHLARNTMITNTSGQKENSFYFVADQTPNDDLNAVLDGRPDTILEYEMVNFNTSSTKNIHKYYDMEWVNGKQTGEKLRLHIIVDMKSNEPINWININPYNPANSTGKVKVYSISTSEDGIDYDALYDDGNIILNSEINTTPQSYRADAIFDGNNDFSESKFSGQGVWTFPTRNARFVEIVLDQEESYPELIGHFYYEKITKDDNGVEKKRVRVLQSQVDERYVNSGVGEYSIDKNLSIYKGLEAFEGWRYAIGLRDINIMAYRFDTKSEFVTQRFEIEGDISKVMLYANEKIPNNYLDKISTSNDWLQYYVTFDDVNWTRISPQHHEPVSDNFPPKIIDVNRNEIETEDAFSLYKDDVRLDGEAKWVRLKVVLSRPEDTDKVSYSSTTPVLEDYALRIIKK